MTTIAIACEKMEGEAAAGNEINLEVYGALTDRLGRCFQRLGLKRQAVDTNDFTDTWRSDVRRQRRPEHRGQRASEQRKAAE